MKIKFKHKMRIMMYAEADLMSTGRTLHFVGLLLLRLGDFRHEKTCTWGFPGVDSEHSVQLYR